MARFVLNDFLQKCFDKLRYSLGSHKESASSQSLKTPLAGLSLDLVMDTWCSFLPPVHLSGSECPRKAFTAYTGCGDRGICAGNGDPCKAVFSSWEGPIQPGLQTTETLTKMYSIHSTNPEHLQNPSAISGAKNPAVNPQKQKQLSRS